MPYVKFDQNLISSYDDITIFVATTKNTKNYAQTESDSCHTHTHLMLLTTNYQSCHEEKVNFTPRSEAKQGITLSK